MGKHRAGPKSELAQLIPVERALVALSEQGRRPTSHKKSNANDADTDQFSRVS